MSEQPCTVVKKLDEEYLQQLARIADALERIAKQGEWKWGEQPASGYQPQRPCEESPPEVAGSV